MSGTNLGKMPILIVALVIGIIMATTAILPLASDYSEAKTFKNDGYFYMSNPSESISMVLSDGVLTINGDSVNPGDDQTYPDGISVLITENSIFRYYGSELRSRGGLIGYHTIGACELTFNNGALTGTYLESGVTTTVNTTYTDLTIISPNKTDIVMCKPVPQYVNSDSLISGAGVVNSPSQATKYWVAEFSGSIDDGITGQLYGQSTGVVPESTHIENATINYVPVDTHKDLYKINSITFDVVGEGGTDEITFTIYMTPSEVTAEPDNPDTYKNLIKIVPLMAFIMLVVAAAAMIISKRD